MIVLHRCTNKCRKINHFPLRITRNAIISIVFLLKWLVIFLDHPCNARFRIIFPNISKGFNRLIELEHYFPVKLIKFHICIYLGKIISLCLHLISGFQAIIEHKFDFEAIKSLEFIKWSFKLLASVAAIRRRKKWKADVKYSPMINPNLPIKRTFNKYFQRYSQRCNTML